jgi:hypothetical protein
MALVGKGPKKDRDEDRSVPKGGVPDTETEAAPSYNGLTIEELELKFVGLAAEFEGKFVSGVWNGASYVEFETGCLDTMATMTRRIKELSMEYRFRSSIKIDVIGAEGLCRMRATLPGKITNDKFA